MGLLWERVTTRHLLPPSTSRDCLQQELANFHLALSRAATPARQADRAVDRPTYNPIDPFHEQPSHALPPDPPSQEPEHLSVTTHSQRMSNDGPDQASVAILLLLMDTRTLRASRILTWTNFANWTLGLQVGGIHTASWMSRALFQPLYRGGRAVGSHFLGGQAAGRH